MLALAEALAPVCDVVVVAPERQQSAAGHAITLHKPLRMTPVQIGDLGVEAYGSNGTPADCVILAVLATSCAPDLVISGINAGANLGEEVLYSGTVSAAMEALLHGLPAVALSVTEYETPDFSAAACFARALVGGWDEDVLCSGCFLNVNVPSSTPEAIAGVEVTRLGRRAYVNQVDKREDPRGRPYYWFSGTPQEIDGGAGTDIGAVNAGRISITPVDFDLTNHEGMEPLRALAERVGGEHLTGVRAFGK
jgi:5'-nucleotidase